MSFLRIQIAGIACATVTLASRAHTGEPTTPVVWYRASEACPRGDVFLERLARKSRAVRLANGGDHIDFVVTLVASDGQTVGSLERQTQSGTVAIRQLRDASCERVADALALSLALALEPSTANSGEPSAQSAETVQPPPAEDATLAPAVTAAALATPPPASAPPADVLQRMPASRPAPPAVVDDRARAGWLGAQGGVETGLAPEPLARGLAFLELHHVIGPVLPDFSARIGVAGVLGSSPSVAGSVQRWLLAARAEGCPWRLGGSSSVAPCVSLEIGVTGASDSRPTGLHAVGAWLAPGGTLRGRVELVPTVALELEVGAAAPLIRHEVYAGASPLYRENPLVFQAGLGVSARAF